MKKNISLLTALLLLGACGSTSRTDGINIDEIRTRLDENACRIMREDLVFRLGELEFVNDTTYSGLPLELLADSFVVCPVTGQSYTLVTDDDHRWIQCPSGHGKTEF